MKRIALVVALSAALAAAAGAYALTRATAEDASTTLISYMEVPSVSSLNGFGQFRARIDDATQTITFQMRWSGLSSQTAASHIHIGQRSVNGGVVAFLCGGSTKPACPTGNAGSIQGTVMPADIGSSAAGQGITGGEWAELVAAMRAGVTYANIHSQTFPGGEIRGQIVTR